MSGEPILVNVRTAGGFHQVIRIRGLTFDADVPEVAGGTDKGPAPEEMLLGSLGSGMAVAALKYAERKAWPLKGVEVDVRKSGDRISTLVRFRGDLDSDQRRRLLQIAEKCPVRKMIAHGVTIESVSLYLFSGNAGGGAIFLPRVFSASSASWMPLRSCWSMPANSFAGSLSTTMCGSTPWPSMGHDLPSRS